MRQLSILERMIAAGRAQVSASEPPAALVERTGEELCEAAIEQVRDHADPEFKAKALAAVHSVALRLDEFTTDDVWPAIGQAEAPHERRVMGAIMRDAAANGWCMATDRTEKSVRAVCHTRPLRVWRSNLRG